MQTIILAAGFGRRTEGVLNSLPKTLIPTSDGKTILDHLLDDLIYNCQINDITIITNSKYYSVINTYLKKDFSKSDILLINDGKKTNEERLGALGDLMFTLQRVKADKDILVLPSDSAYWQSFSLLGFLKFSLQYPDCFVTIVRDVRDKNIIKNRFGCAILNNKNQIIKFIEKPKNPATTYAAAPFYLYLQNHCHLLKKYLDQGGSPDSPGSILPFFLKQGVEIRAYVVENKIIDAGTPLDIEKTKKY